MPFSAPRPFSWKQANVVVPTLIALLLALVGVSQGLHRLAQEKEQDQALDFAYRSAEMHFQIGERFKAYRQVLRGARALFAASERVSRSEWKAYAHELRLDTEFPGIQGVGFALSVAAAHQGAHEQAVREEGFADYRISPPGERAEYAPIVYLEPFDWRNRRAFGYDMLSEPVRRTAMLRTRSLGLATLSGKVRLVQETETDPQAGVLLYLPVFRNGTSPATPAQREEAFVGWVYSPIRMKDLITGTLGNTPDRIRLRIFDGESRTAEALLFDSHPELAQVGRFQATYVLELDGRTWTLAFESTPAFSTGKTVDTVEATSVVLIGALIVLLTASFAGARQRALDLDRIGASLRASEARYSTLVNLSRDGIAAVDGGLRFTFVNPRLAELLGHPADALLGRRLDSLWPAPDEPRSRTLIRRLHRGEGATYEQELIGARGAAVTTQISDAPLLGRNGALLSVIVTVTDISERKESEQRIRYLATHDALTGLANRTMFLELMDASLRLTSRRGTRLAVFFLDLDGFKAVNDRLGHHAGDQLLVATARRIRACLRASDHLARQGGDEFLALIHDVAGADEAVAVARKIHQSLEEPFDLPEGRALISVSIGIALFPVDGTDIDTLTRQADSAMYQAKAGGRNGIRLAGEPVPPEAPQQGS